LSSCVSTLVPVSSPVARRTSSASLTIWLKSLVASGWKTMPALPVVSMPCCVWSATYAVDIAKSRSVFAGLAVRLRPSSVSRNPIRAEPR
jgi:hypothetical protein